MMMVSFDRLVAALFLVSFASGANVRTDRGFEFKDGQARICSMGPFEHSYINLGDGGCFDHLLTGFDREGYLHHRSQTGDFKSPDDKQQYEAKFCPFAHSKKHREILVRFYVTVQRKEYNFRNINDIAMFCTSAENSLQTRAQKMSPVFVWMTDWMTEDPDHPMKFDYDLLCESLLSLPLMVEAIGFMFQGLLIEDDNLKMSLTFMGSNQYASKLGVLEQFSPGPIEGCKKYEVVGPSNIGRLALRMIVPTYAKHVYGKYYND